MLGSGLDGFTTRFTHQIQEEGDEQHTEDLFPLLRSDGLHVAPVKDESHGIEEQRGINVAKDITERSPSWDCGRCKNYLENVEAATSAGGEGER